MGLVRERGETSRRFSSEPRDRYPCLRRSQITMRDGHILLDESNHAAIRPAPAAVRRWRLRPKSGSGSMPWSRAADGPISRVMRCRACGCATLGIVGGNDDIRLNKEALAELRCEKE